MDLEEESEKFKIYNAELPAGELWNAALDRVCGYDGGYKKCTQNLVTKHALGLSLHFNDYRF
jgi:hypothetical protein